MVGTVSGSISTNRFIISGGTINLALGTDTIDAASNGFPQPISSFTAGCTLNITGTGTAGNHQLTDMGGGDLTGCPTLGTVPSGFNGTLANNGTNLVLTLTAQSSGPPVGSLGMMGVGV